MGQAQRLSSLAGIETAIWQELTRATHDRHHEWRTPVLATTGTDGLPDARTVVLREADADAKQLVVYTDSRADKVAQLRAQPAALLVLWSKRLGWQLRCRLRCEVNDDGLAVSSRWAQVKLSPAAQDYLSPLAPGSLLSAQTPAVAHRECFAVVTASVTAIDWLELHREGHRRALFDGVEGHWTQP